MYRKSARKRKNTCRTHTHTSSSFLSFLPFSCFLLLVPWLAVWGCALAQKGKGGRNKGKEREGGCPLLRPPLPSPPPLLPPRHKGACPLVYSRECQRLRRSPGGRRRGTQIWDP